MARKKLDYREHFGEYMELVGRAYAAETRAELRGINRELRRTYGTGHTIPACWVFPPNTKRLSRIALALSVSALIISVAQIVVAIITIITAAG